MIVRRIGSTVVAAATVAAAVGMLTSRAIDDALRRISRPT